MMPKDVSITDLIARMRHDFEPSNLFANASLEVVMVAAADALAAAERDAQQAEDQANNLAGDVVQLEKQVAALQASRKVEAAPSDTEAELREWVEGKRSWCDQHHGLPNEIELTARADEATIRLLVARLDARAALGGGEHAE